MKQNLLNRKTYKAIKKMDRQEMEAFFVDTYHQGFEDGVKAGDNADFKIKLVQVLQNTKRARKISKNTCRCGGQTVLCKYNKRLARICTECGIVWREKKAVQRCWVNSRRVG